jgi:hypothetical protein
VNKACTYRDSEGDVNSNSPNGMECGYVVNGEISVVTVKNNAAGCRLKC